jgi:hypothetical protein
MRNLMMQMMECNIGRGFRQVAKGFGKGRISSEDLSYLPSEVSLLIKSN